MPPRRGSTRRPGSWSSCWPRRGSSTTR
jgi:hypothetical protein